MALKPYYGIITLILLRLLRNSTSDILPQLICLLNTASLVTPSI